MDIKLGDIFTSSSVIHSEEADAGAANLIKRCDSGEMAMEIMPNTSVEFTGEQEEKNHLSYCEFLKSKEGLAVLKILEDSDEEKFLELW